MFKKTITLLLIVLLLVPSSTLFAPKTAEAVFPTIDWSNLAQNTFTAFKDGKELTKQFKLDKIPIKIAKKLLDKMTDSVIVWAAGGFKKEGPAFIGNFKQYARDNAILAGTAAIDELVAEGERYASANLTATEKAEEKKCVDNKKEYDKYVNLVATGLLQSGIKINGAVISLKNDGPVLFNNLLATYGYPSYALGNGQVNLVVLYNFIENEILLNPAALAEAGIPGDVNVIEDHIKVNEKCQKTLALKVAGLTYTNSLVKFVGQSYRNGRQGTASRVGVPNFSNFGAAYTKSLSDNWKGFQTNASQGGWAAWSESAKLANNPSGAKFILQTELSDQLAQDLGEKTAQIQRNAGFLDKGECKTWKTLDKSSGGTERICVDYEANNPGSIIREAVNKRVTQQYDQLNNVKEWQDLLLTTGVKLVSGVLQEGVLPLANNAIDQGLADLAAQFQEDANGQTTVASSQTITNSGNNVDDVVDIASVLYGQPVLERDENGNALYERVDPNGNIVHERRNKFGVLTGLVAYLGSTERDQSGQIIKRKWTPLYTIKVIPPTQTPSNNPTSAIQSVTQYTATKVGGGVYNAFWPGGVSSSLEPALSVDYARPLYRYVLASSTDDTLVYETAKGGVFQFDANGDYIPKLVRINGSIDLASNLTRLLDLQYNFIKTRGIDRILRLDHVLPGPDIGWEDRLAEKLPSDSNGEKQSAMREVYEFVKRKFEQGVNGTLINDPFDVVAVVNGVPYTSPEYTFLNFEYPVSGPGTFNIQYDGTPTETTTTMTKTLYDQYHEKTFPKVMQVQRYDNDALVTETAVIVNMNTFPGMWYSPDTKKAEAIGNIPEASAIRDTMNATISQYSEAVDTYKRRSSELKIVETKLRELRSKYESLPVITDNTPLETRVERTQKENDIAYQISLIKDRLPIYDEVQEVQSSIKSMLMSYDKMSELQLGTKIYKDTNPNYSIRFGQLQVYRGDEDIDRPNDLPYKGVSYYVKTEPYATKYKGLFIKDQSSLLYCGLQDQSMINMGAKQAVDTLADDLFNAVKTLYTGVAGILLGSFSPKVPSRLLPHSAFPPCQQKGTCFWTFGGNVLFDNGVERKWLESGTRVQDTLGYLAPFRCYRTSVQCSNDGLKCDTFKWECSVRANPTGEGNFMAALPTSCKSVYRSSLNDYLRRIDPDSAQ